LKKMEAKKIKQRVTMNFVTAGKSS
jgi:hypothetical protein